MQVGTINRTFLSGCEEGAAKNEYEVVLFYEKMV